MLERHVGLLQRRQHFGRVHVAAGHELLHGLVGLALHRVHLVERLQQDVLERLAASCAGRAAGGARPAPWAASAASW